MGVRRVTPNECVLKAMNLIFAQQRGVGMRPFEGLAVRRPRVASAVLLCVLLLSACGNHEQKATSQVAARVNKDEVTIHQVNQALQAQRGLRPEQAELASSRILERLVDQQLAVQKAQALKIDRDPKVVQQIEATRSEIIARAYFDKLAEGVGKPTPEEVTSYYNDNPALFRERRIYQLQEIAIAGQVAQLEAIRRHVESNKPVDDLLIYLRSNNVNYTTNQVVRAAEQVPLGTLPTLSKLRPGQAMMVASPDGAQVVALIESRAQAIDEDRARPAIEQFMINDRKRKVVTEDVKALRAAAKIEYVGKFAAAAPVGTGAAPTVADAAASAARDIAGTSAAAATIGPAPRSPVSAASAPTGAASQSSTGLSTSVINKGFGLK